MKYVLNVLCFASDGWCQNILLFVRRERFLGPFMWTEIERNDTLFNFIDGTTIILYQMTDNWLIPLWAHCAHSRHLLIYSVTQSIRNTVGRIDNRIDMIFFFSEFYPQLSLLLTAQHLKRCALVALVCIPINFHCLSQFTMALCFSLGFTSNWF